MKAIISIFIFLLGLLMITTLLGLSMLSTLVFVFTTILILQGLFATYGMLYSWMHAEENEDANLQQLESASLRSFSLIVPARYEKEVIGDTIRGLQRINYPKDKYEILVVIREDDLETILETQRVLMEIKEPNFRIITFAGFPINKAKGLNEGLNKAKYENIGIFDAEDEPSAEILHRINQEFDHSRADVIQATVQPITLNSSWYSAYNCLEYFFWYKSILPLFSKFGAAPVGGNTVFFNKQVLIKSNGWSENTLTEDAEIGIRLSALGYKIHSIYDKRIATLEETPVNLKSFIRQRTRWNQGFLQVLIQGDWKALPSLKQQLMAIYILLQPVIHHFAILGFFLMAIFAAGFKVPIWLAIYSYIPLYLLLMELGISIIGLGELAKMYDIKISKSFYVGILLSYVSYQLILVFASSRAFFRLYTNMNVWEKTSHANAHRSNIYQYLNA